ncbi:unnamed protein product (macronuclear) [Paramecium tetraurelia]|uniref:Uncharacterized protein n=1 Tax=Paramecium tetraurelia TaxID=5888 RepID=A0CD52_PARTE|nr:uncharacterized protein GSPATT00006930001 [Paramecium tetraurelia]CAK68719.1 unnamed protein product [Paramecium tetraurelia]|eukprot:XP_001436116.1 hypothetical protein (macronuclear) [Paramecium tetraurelia strain d4-2]
MKQRKKEKVAYHICFESEKQNSQELITKGKQLINQIPNIKIVNSILQKYFGYIIQPKPFQKLKNPKIKHKTDLHSNLQYLEKLKATHFDRELIQEIKNKEANFSPSSIQYRNCLTLTSEFRDHNVLEYIFEEKLRRLEWKCCAGTSKFLVQEFTEKDLYLNDHTGVQQLIKQNDRFYLKHLYSVEVVKNEKSVSKYSSADQINQILYEQAFDRLYILTNKQLKTEDTILQQFSSQQAEAFWIQSIALHKNPFLLFLQSQKELQLFDQRKQNTNVLVPIDVHNLLTNRIYAVHQFQQSQYIVLSTNTDLQFYDLRNLKNPFSTQQHGCMETGISQFVSISDQTINFDDLFDQDDFQLNRNKTYSNAESVIGYSNIGNSIFINFDCGLVTQVKTNLPSLRMCTNLLIDNSLQYGTSDLTQNGFPMLIGNSQIFSKRLKNRGFQYIYLDKKYFIFSLDKQGGLGLQILDSYFDPIPINQQSKDINEILMVESSEKQDVNRCSNDYDSIFDEFQDIQDSDLELVEIQELLPKVKKVKLSNFAVEEFNISEENGDEGVQFEDEILLEKVEKENQNESIAQLKQNQNFVLTQDIINYMLKQI